MACERCGQTHDPKKCVGHVDEEDGTLRPCIAWPIRGGRVCVKHGGSARQVKAKAEGRLETARLVRSALRLGVPREVDPADALLEMVFEAAGNVEFYRDLVGQLSTRPGSSDAGDDETPEVVSTHPGSLYGALRHQSGVLTGEAKRHILVQLYDDERDRLKEYAATVVKVGLAERQVRVVEMQAALVAKVVMAVLDDPELGLSFESRELGRRLAGRHLRQLAVGTGSAA